MQLREKELMRQQHEQMLNEHRELIDALTAEILLVREENTIIQVLSPHLPQDDKEYGVVQQMCAECIVMCSGDFNNEQKENYKIE